MSFLRRLRPSPAMVVACIALSVALGGTGYAAIKLPKNSVGTKQLKKNAVTSPKVKANALTGADIKESSLGTVPSATNATNATNATHATNATNATHAANAASARNATNAGTLDGIDSVDVLPGGTLPAGKTIRGNWLTGGPAAGVNNLFWSAISFGYALGAAPTAHLLAPGAPATPECPGSLAAPAAASGHLCIYTKSVNNVSSRFTCNPLNNTCGASQTNPWGTVVYVSSAGAGSSYSWGTWAVTG